MHYTVTTQGHRRFDVYDDAGRLVGTMAQNTWRPLRAEITVGDTIYRAAPTGFWQTTMVITRNDSPFAEIKFSMRTGLKINFTSEGSPYYFRYKGFWHTTYTVKDDYGNEIGLLQTHFNWKRWKYDYEIKVHPNNLAAEANHVLPLLMMYCLRYTRVLQSGTV